MIRQTKKQGALASLTLFGAALWITPAPALAQGQMQILSAEQLTRQTIERRAVEAAIWGMPIVAMDAMRQAFLRDAGATYGDIAYWSKPADWKLRVTTPNASSLYVYLNYNLKDGPMVLELPAATGAGLFGSITDAWQAPLIDVGPAGEDRGKGGRYVILPPDYKGAVPKGMIAVRSPTINGYSILRAIPETRSAADTAKAIDLVKKMRLYPLARAADPPPQRHIDMAGKLFDGIAAMDDTFFESLARMIDEEPVQARDMVAMGQLTSIGIEKGRPFRPDAAMREILKKAAAEAQTELMDAVTRTIAYWPNAKWGDLEYIATAVKTGFTFETANGLDVDSRAVTFFLACAVPKKLGAATYYLTGVKDSTGALLDGAKTYRLRVPADVPAKQFWAVTVYDLEDAAFFRDAPKVEVNSYERLKKNADGSVDVFFGPEAPKGQEANWVYTAPGKQWVSLFRFYGPQKALFDKTWALGDFEPVAGTGVGARALQ